MLWNIPLTCPLQGVDHATGETLKEAMQQTMDTPLYSDIEGLFPNKYELHRGDGAASNVRAFAGLASAFDGASISTRCNAHIASTVTGRTYGTVPGLISGVIALGLSFKPGGATSVFRGVLREVLEASFEVVSPPLQQLDMSLSDSGIYVSICFCQVAMRATVVYESCKNVFTEMWIPTP